MKNNTKVFLDIIIGSKAAGRITIELFEDRVPFTCENFRGLCSGDYGKSASGTDLYYQDSLFFKLVPGKYIAGGDIISNNGKSGESIYGKTFIDESFQMTHSELGTVSTYTQGPNTNTSSFIITLGACPELDNKNVVFGKVTDGISVLRKIEKTPTDSFFKPSVPVRIFNSGQLDDGREHVKFEEFRDQIKIYRAFEERKAQRKEKHLQEYYEMTRNEGKKEIEENIEEEGESDSENQEKDELAEGSSVSARLARIKADLKKAKKMNEQEVVKEKEKLEDPAAEKKRKKQEWLDKEKSKEANREILGIPQDKAYLSDNIAHAGNVQNKKRKRDKRNVYGWEVFNSDAHMRAYKKRIAKIQLDKDLAKTQNEDKTSLVLIPSQEKIDKMAQELEEENERKSKFSRRRPFYEDLDVNYINERNRVYNMKLERTYKDYAAEIKRNLERGTNL